METKLIREKALLKCIGDVYDKLDPNKPVEDQLDDFLTGIGFVTDIPLIRDCFLIASKMYYKDISNTHIVLKLDPLYPELKRCQIRNLIFSTFKDWLVNHPKLSEDCPKMSFFYLLKLFSKKFN